MNTTSGIIDGQEFLRGTGCRFVFKEATFISEECKRNMYVPSISKLLVDVIRDEKGCIYVMVLQVR